ncbi:MAG: DUF4838 domain-containing protein [Planctomycetota bacterium]|jgi:hypothetical protein
MCRISLSVFVGFGWLATSSVWAAEIELSGRTRISIREEGPLGPSAGLLSDVLEEYLSLATRNQEVSRAGPEVVFVLEARAGDWRDLPPGEIENVSDADAFEIIISASPEPRVTILGQTPLSTGYGVMHFLEKHLGVFRAFPGELGLCLTAEGPVRLKAGREKVSPWAVTRVLSGVLLRDGQNRRERDRRFADVPREHRSFFLADDYFKSLRLHQGAVTHNMIHVFPVEECRATCPGIFPRNDDGTPFIPEERPRKKDRTGQKAYQAWHPCYTHPKTLEVAAAKGKEVFADGRLFYSLGINDGRRVQCQCATCREVGWPESYYRFVNHVADGLRDYYPPQMVGVLAYGDVGIPPRGLRLRENVLVNVAGMRKGVWEGLAPALGTYEYIYGAGYVIPNLPLDVIRENFRYYQKHNLRMYRAELYPVWAFDAPKAYVVSRLLWDPNQDVYALLRTFCDRTFGEAAAPMQRYYAQLASIRRDDARPGRFTPVWNRQWPFREPLQLFGCPEDLHEGLFECLDEAKRAKLTDRQRRRLAMIEAFTRFSAVYTQMYRLKEEVFSGAADAKTAVVRAKKLEAQRKQVLAELGEHPEWFVGSALKAERLHERPWPTLRIEQQMEAAVSTAALELAASGDRAAGRAARYAGTHDRSPFRLLPLRREEHPRFKPEQHVPVDTIALPGGRGFTFQTRPNVRIREGEDPRRPGEPKAQWFLATGRDLPVQEGVLYELTVDLHGRGGTLQLRGQGTEQSLDRRQYVFVHGTLAFGEDEENALRRVVMDPTAYLDRPDEPQPATTTNVQLQLLWRPDDVASELHGQVKLEQITIRTE